MKRALRRVAAVRDPESFSVKELGVTTGIVLDRIAKAERWGVEEGGSSSGVEALHSTAEAIRAGKLQLDRMTRPVHPAERAVDVTPES